MTLFRRNLISLKLVQNVEREKTIRKCTSFRIRPYIMGGAIIKNLSLQSSESEADTTRSRSWNLTVDWLIDSEYWGNATQVSTQTGSLRKGVRFFLAALAALYLTLISQWVTGWVPLLNFNTKSDFWHLRPFRHLIRVMSRQKDKKEKKNKSTTKRETKHRKSAKLPWCHNIKLSYSVLP